MNFIKKKLENKCRGYFSQTNKYKIYFYEQFYRHKIFYFNQILNKIMEQSTSIKFMKIKEFAFKN